MSGKRLYKEMSEPDLHDTPKIFMLKRRIKKLVVYNIAKSKSLKYLKQKVQRQAKKIASMKVVLQSLKDDKSLHNDHVLSEQFGKHNNLIIRFIKV